MKNSFFSGLLALFLLSMVLSCSVKEEPQPQTLSLSSLIAQETNAIVSETERSTTPPVPTEGTTASPAPTAQPESAQGAIASLMAGSTEATEATATPRSALSALLANAPTATSFATNTIRPTATPTRRPTATPSPRPTVTPSRRPTATPRVSATPAPTHRPISASYIGNKNTKKFHRPDCGSAKQIAQKNVISFSSREEAVNQGYQPCKRCKP